MAKVQPACVTVWPWLRENLGKGCTAALTGTDAKALSAAVQIVELYAYDSEPSIGLAFGRVVSRMQPSTRELAYHAIAHVMDWSDRERLWNLAGLPGLLKVRRCTWEPKPVDEILGVDAC